MGAANGIGQSPWSPNVRQQEAGWSPRKAEKESPKVISSDWIDKICGALPKKVSKPDAS